MSENPMNGTPKMKGDPKLAKKLCKQCYQFMIAHNKNR